MEVAEDAAASGDESAVRWHVITRREHHVVNVTEIAAGDHRACTRHARVEASLESDLHGCARFLYRIADSLRVGDRQGDGLFAQDRTPVLEELVEHVAVRVCGQRHDVRVRRSLRCCLPVGRAAADATSKIVCPRGCSIRDDDLRYARVRREIRGANVAHAAGSDDDNGPSWSCHVRSCLSRPGFCRPAVVGRCSSLAGRGHSVTRSLRILERSKESACPPSRPPTFPRSSPSGA